MAGVDSFSPLVGHRRPFDWRHALTIAASKAGLSFGVAFVRGTLANALVCLAVWLATAGRSVTDKVLAITFP